MRSDQLGRSSPPDLRLTLKGPMTTDQRASRRMRASSPSELGSPPRTSRSSTRASRVDSYPRQERDQRCSIWCSPRPSTRPAATAPRVAVRWAPRARPSPYTCAAASSTGSRPTSSSSTATRVPSTHPFAALADVAAGHHDVAGAGLGQRDHAAADLVGDRRASTRTVSKTAQLARSRRMPAGPRGSTAPSRRSRPARAARGARRRGTRRPRRAPAPPLARHSARAPAPV